ncbi:MAG: thiol-disulfide oxidoreductase DCC family protein [Chitinophagaceae bacterium]
MQDHPLIFFDGICNFCNYWVNFAIKHDRKKRLRFSPLQGNKAREVLSTKTSVLKKAESVIVLDKGRIWTRSSAALRICRYLDGGWKILYGLILVPKFIRDPVYIMIARNRYRWFGKKDACMVPGPDVRERFLL